MSIFLVPNSRAILRRTLHRRGPCSPFTHHRFINLRPPVRDANVTSLPSLPISQRLGPLSKVLAAYSRVLQARPNTTQLCTSLVIYFCGELSAQYISGEDYDAWKMVRTLSIGALAAIPVFKWTVYLGNYFNYSSKVLSMAAKIAMNQVIFTPLFGMYFFGTQSLFAGATLPEAWDRVRETVPKSALNACKFWPAAMTFIYTCIEPRYRALVIGIAQATWQTYLSLLNQWAIDEEIKRGLRPPPQSRRQDANPTIT